MFNRRLIPGRRYNVKFGHLTAVADSHPDGFWSTAGMGLVFVLIHFVVGCLLILLSSNLNN